MIIAYTGLPGGGKSLSALEDYLLPALRANRHVFSNIVGLVPLQISNMLGTTSSTVNRYLHRFALGFDDDRAAKEQRYMHTRDDGTKYYANVQGLEKLMDQVMEYNEALFILDECHEFLAPENWKLLGKFRKYLSMARHYGHDIVLITQHIDDIWQPIKNRIHETHNFVRGQLGSKNQYSEVVYHGHNVYGDPAFKKNRLNNKRLYVLYASHDNGAQEHLKYISIWQNKKFVALLSVGVSMLIFSVFFIFSNGGISGMLMSVVPETGKTKPTRYNESDMKVVYVRYVVCDLVQCKGVKPDGSVILLPLDYDSGKYPFRVERAKREKTSSALTAGVTGSIAQ